MSATQKARQNFLSVGGDKMQTKNDAIHGAGQPGQIDITHRHLSNIDCLMACTTCLVCFISTVNGRSEKKNKRSLLRAVPIAGT